MSIGEFQIRFDNSHAYYIGGQHVTGHVVIVLHKEKTLRGIELKFSGKGEVWWTEKNGDDSDSYSAREVYIKNSVFLVGGESTDITLPPGRHVYPFRLILPTNLPSSFEGVHGKVRYVINAALVRPWKFDHKCKAAFTVLNPLDLNSEPHIQEPAQITTEKYLCCGCCGSPITIVLSLPTTGFVPGQSCHATVEIDNASPETVTAKFALVQVVTFIESGGRKNVCKKTIVKENLGVVQSHGSLTTPATLQIPVLPDSYLRNCNCIDISYIAQAIGVVSGCHRNTDASVPVVIGSIPLRTHFARIVPSPVDAASAPPDGATCKALGGEADHESAPSHFTDPFARYPEMPPPTYEECTTDRINIRSKEDNEYVQGNMEFAPRYPKYQFQ